MSILFKLLYMRAVFALMHVHDMKTIQSHDQSHIKAPEPRPLPADPSWRGDCSLYNSDLTFRPCFWTGFRDARVEERQHGAGLIIHVCFMSRFLL